MTVTSQELNAIGRHACVIERRGGSRNRSKRRRKGVVDGRYWRDMSTGGRGGGRREKSISDRLSHGMDDNPKVKKNPKSCPAAAPAREFLTVKPQPPGGTTRPEANHSLNLLLNSRPCRPPWLTIKLGGTGTCTVLGMKMG